MYSPSVLKSLSDASIRRFGVPRVPIDIEAAALKAVSTVMETDFILFPALNVLRNDGEEKEKSITAWEILSAGIIGKGVAIFHCLGSTKAWSAAMSFEDIT